MLIVISVSARLADNDHHRTPSASNITAISSINTTSSSASKSQPPVRTVTDELGTCGPTTPFLYSSLALNISSSRVHRLIQVFLCTCVSFPAPDVEYTWGEEVRFAAPSELAMWLRWGLARVLRVSGANAVHGLISWDMYVEWNESDSYKRFGDLIAPSNSFYVDHHQGSLLPCPPHSPPVVLRTHPSHCFTSFRPWPSCTSIPT